MTKVYGIYEYHSANDEGKMIATVSSKTKAVDYIKSCIGNAKYFRARENNKIWYKADYCYPAEKALTRKNILNYRYLTNEHYNYYVKEITVL